MSAMSFDTSPDLEHAAGDPVPTLACSDLWAGAADGGTGSRRWLVRGVDWRVEQGEHWVILGANGAGKSTLLALAAGRIEPTRGSVRVLGRTHGSAGYADPRLAIGQLPDRSPTLASQLSVLDAVMLRASGSAAVLGRARTQSDRERAEELLDLFECRELAARRYGSCSQGERQRVLLARALMHEPALLLLDEPTGGLDLLGREALLKGMERLARAQPTLSSVTVTHHVEEIPRSASHAMLLRSGDVLAAGPIDDTLNEDGLSRCFDAPMTVRRVRGRWLAHLAA